jgi:hypothetical protein
VVFSLRGLFTGDGNAEEDAPYGRSDYDGRPLHAHNLEGHGRQITVLSSWKEGDPAR